MRLDKFLSAAGVGTRNEVKKLLKAGAVTISGTEGKPRPEQHIDPQRDEVFVGGARVRYQEFVYLMLNKPAGYVSATWDSRLPTVLDLVEERYLHFSPVPVGRLDIDTEGLLILTNDGGLNHRLLSPAHHVPKTYLALLDGEVDGETVRLFRAGVTLDDGYRTLPAELTPLGWRDGDFAAEIVITEGKFHQVKRMFAAAGRTVRFLKRTGMNRLKLDETLPLGQARELTETELELLQNE